MPYRTAFFTMAFVAVAACSLPVVLLAYDHYQMTQQIETLRLRLAVSENGRQTWARLYSDLHERINIPPRRPGSGSIGSAPSAN